MSQRQILEKLHDSKLKFHSKIKSTFSKVQNNKFKDLSSYFFEMDKIARGYKLKVITSTTREGYPLNYLELKTSMNKDLKFCEEIFTQTPNDFKLGNDMLYANSYLGYIIGSNITKLTEALNNEFKNDKLIKIRWCHYSNMKTYVINLRMPRGEIFYFKNKAQHLDKYSNDWLKTLVKPPVLYYHIGSKRYNVSRDQKTLHVTGLKIPIQVKKKKMLSCFNNFLHLAMSKKLMSDLEALGPKEEYYWDSLYSENEDEFWYFQERCSINWAAKYVNV